MRTERADITQVLNQMRAMREQAQRGSNALPLADLRAPALEPASRVTGGSNTGSSVNGNSFGNALRQALDGVNQSQVEADGLARGYELGQPGVDLTRVMIATQKANLSFQAAVQVRNKLVSAYQEIMNMPI